MVNRDCNYGLIAMNVSRFYPADFEIQFEGNLGDSVNVDPNGKVVPFRIKNITHNDEPLSEFQISIRTGIGTLMNPYPSDHTVLLQMVL